MLEEFISYEMKKLAKWIEIHVLEAALSKLFGTEESSAEKVAQNKAVQTSYAMLAGARAMSEVGWPAALAVGPVVFSEAMVFAQGGEVPGYGMGDTVPAMLTPGETVVTKQLTDQVKNSVGAGRGGDIHVHTSVNAVDAAGFEGLLKKHAALITRHVGREMRRQNR